MALTLKQVVDTFSKDELLKHLKNISYLSAAIAKYGKEYANPDDFLTKLLRYCEKHKVSQRVAEDLDLLQVIANHNEHEWQVYEFTSPTSYFQDVDDPHLLMQRVEKKLKLGPRATNRYIMKDGILWFRSYIENPIIKEYNTTMYAAYSFHSYIIVAKFSNTLEKETILQAVTSALNYHTCRDLPLNGHCVSSLMRLHHEKNNLGYKMKFDHRNPLLDFEKTEETKLLEMNTTERTEKREEYIQSAFGPFQQPRLQSVQFDLQTPLDATPENEVINSKVIFQGQSVLEGFREMVEVGVMDYPIPEHIETIRANGSNAAKLMLRRK